MANYYNATIYRNTGFTALHRPARRSVLEAVTDKSYIQGIVVNRAEMPAIGFIDIQGSVKDVKGTQLNQPNSTGSHGPDGPFYNLEQADYVRLVRTGYPGDPDFIDISNNMSDPWNAAKTAEQKPLRVGYYFITGLEPLARNVTRVFLSYDYWLSAGGLDDVTLTGYKIRGHITDAEDAANYNMVEEGVSLSQPLEITNYADVGQTCINANNRVIISTPADLEKIEQATTWQDLKYMFEGSTNAYAQVPHHVGMTSIVTNMPDGEVLTSYYEDVGFYNYAQYEKALEYLNMIGSLNIVNAYQVPIPYVSGPTGTIITSLSQKVDNPSARNIGSYPRKADYYWGSDVLISKGSGVVNQTAFSEVTDRTVGIWANVLPGGAPYARFMGIKSKAHLWDGAVQGAEWVNSTISFNVASGLYWSQRAAQLQVESTRISSNTRQAEYANQQQTIEEELKALNATFSQKTASSLASDALSMLAVGGLVGGGVGAVIGVAAAFVKAGASYLTSSINTKKEAKLYNMEQATAAETERLAAEADIVAIDTILMGAQQTALSTPAVAYAATPAAGLLRDNRFATAVCNASQQDRLRLRTFLQQYGYSGLYKPLANNIEVKSKVNYTQAVNVHATHSYLPHRYLEAIETMFTTGVFLWNSTVDFTAFDNNPDA